MKWYTAEVADNKVALFSNGLDNLISKTGYDFEETTEWDDADILVVFSAKFDKAVQKLTDKLEEEGSTAGLRVAILAEDSEENSFYDLMTIAGERNRASALSDFLKMIDYYLHIGLMDVGYELSGRGKLIYGGTAGGEDLSNVLESAVQLVGKAREGIILLEAGENVFSSDIANISSALSEATDGDYLIIPVRTLEHDGVLFHLFYR